MRSVSKIIAITNVSIVSLSIISGIWIPPFNRPGPAHPVMILALFYIMLSFVPAAIGIFIGLAERKKPEIKKPAYIGLIINGVYLFSFISFVVYMWPRWMGI